MPTNTLPNPPLLLVHLELLEHSHQGLPLLLAHHLHYLSDVLYHSQLYLVVLVFEEDIDHFEEVLLSKGLADQFGNFMQTLAQRNLYPFVLHFQ